MSEKMSRLLYLIDTYGYWSGNPKIYSSKSNYNKDYGWFSLEELEDLWGDPIAEESDEMDATQWIYSEVHKQYKHIYTGKIFDEKTWNMWFPEGKVEKDKSCRHEWEPVLLLHRTVYDCKKCGAKKEDEK